VTRKFRGFLYTALCVCDRVDLVGDVFWGELIIAVSTCPRDREFDRLVNHNALNSVVDLDSGSLVWKMRDSAAATLRVLLDPGAQIPPGVFGLSVDGSCT
jgi:hypothetical protein